MKVLLATVALAAITLHAHATELKFEVSGLEKSDGQVMIALYNDEGEFLKKRFKGVRLAPNGKSVSGTFGDVPEGHYAVSAIHDENGNGKLDFNAVGMPIERMGFSNDAMGIMGPPSFANAKFEVNGAAKSIVINLR